MADKLLTIEVDSTATVAAMARVAQTAHARCKSAARVSADSIAREARGRVRRRTGETAAGITVEETHNGDGYVVFVNQPDNPGLAGWIEHGTKYMPARGFLFISAQLEEGPHRRRIAAALDDAIDETGLGE